jgi:hypothetical protein
MRHPKFVRDGLKFNDPLYKQAWNESFSYCRSAANPRLL